MVWSNENSLSVDSMLINLGIREYGLCRLAEENLPVAFDGFRRSENPSIVLSGSHNNIEGVPVIVFRKQVISSNPVFNMPDRESLVVPCWLFYEALEASDCDDSMPKPSVGAELVRAYYRTGDAKGGILKGVQDALECYKGVLSSDEDPVIFLGIDLYIERLDPIIVGCRSEFRSLCEALKQFNHLIVNLEKARIEQRGVPFIRSFDFN